MRILMLSPEVTGVGGIQQQVLPLVRGLRARGHEVKIISSENTPHAPIQGLRNATLALASTLRVFGERFDVVHAHNLPMAFPMKAALGRRVLSLHGFYEEVVQMTRGRSAARVGRWLEDFGLGAADAITAVSQRVAHYYREKGFRVHFVPCAVAPEEIPVTGVRLHERQVVLMGRVSREKGVDILLRTASRIPHANFLVIGSGPALAAHRAHAPPNVTFLGALERRQALRYLRGSDLLVVPSRAEGLPVVILEAFASGVPVIATRVGGIPELVADGQTGILIEPERDDLLAEAILRALAEEGLRRRLAANAAVLVRSTFNWASVIELYLKVYRGEAVPG